MKLVYKSLSISHRQVGVVKKTLQNLKAESPEVFADIKFKVTDVYAVITGFENWEDFLNFDKISLSPAPCSEFSWTNFEFTRNLSMRWEEECAAYQADNVRDLVAKVASEHDALRFPPYDEFRFDGIVSNHLSSFSQIVQTYFGLMGPRSNEDVQDENGRAIARSEPPEARLAEDVIAYANRCINTIGRKEARSSRIWTPEFACAMFAAARELEEAAPGKFHTPNPIQFLHLFAQFFGYQDFDAYQANQSDPKTCNYDSRPDSDLPLDAQKLRKLMRLGCLTRYFLKLNLEASSAEKVAMRILESLPEDFCSISVCKVTVPSADLMGLVKQEMLNPTVVGEIIQRLQSSNDGGEELSFEDLKKVQTHYALCMSEECEKFSIEIKRLCMRWGAAGLDKHTMAYRTLMKEFEGGKPEWAFWLAQFLLDYPRKGKEEIDWGRARDFLLKIINDATSWTAHFTIADCARQYACLASERLSSSEKHQHRAEALKAALQILEKPSLLSVEEIKQKYFTGPDGVVDQAAFIELSNDLDIAQKTALQLGFLDKESILRSLQLQRGAE